MGTALSSIFENYDLVCKNSKDFDACDFDSVRELVNEVKPDILINTVALVGIDPSEDNPEKAYQLNTLYPGLLANLSKELGFLLIHFSTDGVFCDRDEGYYNESDKPRPLHIYGITKYGGDCLIQALTEKYYICRIPLLFGETTKKNQFVEKMLEKSKVGPVKIADDLYSSPSYSKDIAREVKRMIEEGLPFGLYHVVNEGKASLYDVFKEIVENFKLDIKVERASYKDFPSKSIKNTMTPMKSEKIKCLRPWREAVVEYTKSLKKEKS